MEVRPLSAALLFAVCASCGPQAAPVMTDHLPLMDAETHHQTDFLTAGDFTHLYAGRSARQRQQIVEALRRSGYTHIYIYVINENDYDGTKFNYYVRPHDFRKILSQLKNDGLLPVVWLAPDDAPQFHQDFPPDKIAETWTSFIPAIDDLVSSYVVGLEMDEYWSQSQQSFLGAHLRSLTGKPILVHYRPGLWGGVLEEWANGIVYQYGVDKSPEQISKESRFMVQKLASSGKIFIAGEYSAKDVKTSVELGKAALDAGAHGFGNGGPPRWRSPFAERRTAPRTAPGRHLP